MDGKTFLDELLKTGRSYAEKGQKIVQEKIQIDQDTDSGKARLDGMKKGAIAAGAVALLLGTKSGRKLSGTALKLGSLAAVGGIAYQAWQNLKDKESNTSKSDESPALPEKVTPINELQGEAAEDRAMILIKAMMAVAKADGVVDDEERETINRQLERMDLTTRLEDVMKAGSVTPLSAKTVARMADGDTEVSAEIYLVSIMVADQENEQEQQYINELADELALPADLIEELNTYRKN